MTFEDDLRTLVRARYPVIWVQTHEEERVLRYVTAVAQRPKGTEEAPAKAVFLWSRSKGLESVYDPEHPKQGRKVVEAELNDPIALIGKVIADAEGSSEEGVSGQLYVMRDLHRFFGDGPDATYRFVRDAAHALRLSKTTLVVTSPVSNLPMECEKDVVVIDLPLPTAEELRVRLDEVLEGLDSKVERPKNGQVERVLKAGLGLSEDEFAGAVKESIIRTGKVDPRVVIKQKEQVIRKSGVVELYSSVEGLESVGGLDRLRLQIEEMVGTFTDKAAKFGCRPTKGLLLTGPPGTGKTLTAKAAANHLGFPLLWLKADAVFSKYVGESEQNMRKVLKLADAVSPCVLFIDECEKLLAGSSSTSSDSGDSGVSKRVFGSLLTYMQEHTTPVLVIATVNNPLAVPGEMMSRFDVVFFVDLPQVAERRDILAIHLEKVKRDPTKFDLNGLAKLSDAFCGREIEKVVNAALSMAFNDGKELSTDYLARTFQTFPPLAKSRKSEIEAMRDWARMSGAIPASSTAVLKQKVGSQIEV